MYPLTALLVLATPSIDARWAAVAACPRVVNRTGDAGSGTGVTVGVKGGFAYVLTADHVVAGSLDREVHFFTRATYPRPARTVRGAETLARFADPDLALIRVRVGSDPVNLAALAPPGERPKRFPFTGVSVGCSAGGPPTCRDETVIGKRPARRPGGGIAFFWEIAAPPVPGRSGGPLFDGRGRVIGICSAAGGGKGYYTHPDEILAGLKREGYGWFWASDADNPPASGPKTP